MKVYRRNTTTTINDYHFYQTTDIVLLEEKPENKIIKGDWNNIEEKAKFFTGIGNIKHKKRGLILTFYSKKLIYRDYVSYKQWKDALNIVYKETYEEIEPSIETILKHNDGNKAIQYLVERGIKVLNNA